MERIIHLVFNAHIDPVWLWPWQAGLDEVLATLRSACEQLEAHPDLIFTQGEAWAFYQVEQIDPKLFERIRLYVQEGRWEIAGGWWIQPDCNLPSIWGLEKQIVLGRRYLEEKFGFFPRVAYNIDSFGHAATLPRLLRKFGQDCYVMMRPQEHEMPLPARLFRWRGFEGDPEITVFRIARAYTTRDITLEHVKAALSELPDGIEHTMCFVGLGDHGGGPTERQIAWCRKHATAISGWRMIFSSPRRFFEAISAQRERLPLVTGELQHHAIGCYSVYRPIKTAIRRAEHRLRQAELLLTDWQEPRNGASSAQYGRAWQRVCFAHFHDTLGGTCIPSAYPTILEQVGAATADAEEALHIELRKRLQTFAADECQRVIAMNASDSPFEGYIEHEPWLDWQAWPANMQLVDTEGQPIPFQLMEPEACSHGLTRLLFRTRLQPCEVRTVARIVPNATPAAVTSGITISEHVICNDCGVGCSAKRLQFNDSLSLRAPDLDLLEDPTDTWSHGIDRYVEQPIGKALWEEPVVLDRGPLLGSFLQEGQLCSSPIRAEWRVYVGEEFVELRLSLCWMEPRKVLKLVIPLPCPAVRRYDGIPGGWLERANDGAERPIRDAMLILLDDGSQLGIVCPDVFAADATSERVRLTLLRNALMAHHDPHPGTSARAELSDRGVHRFRFRFFYKWGDLSSYPDLTLRQLDSHALMLHRPPLLADLTRGMRREC
ncbi:alpha-mannosidase [Chthonomonas calidirosea]|uniref:Alpha-mannosidase n=1 Tax=Chthonomonas calidirosea (strain DSM 23976 / ICMP 18418 / T49) TaxID=1303518 RepID=S0EVV1_CHTCT|nr:alpha-mannosidase [Chthonomonas calidirosea]CCW35572.1 Alpha-mannosidase [Chthonomonas calidirosea T49]CEK19873.1 alpha-mannosidase [Chthonomonas calidirosea]